MKPFPWTSLIWYGTRRSTCPASAARMISATVISWPRKPSRRWTSVISDAVSRRLIVQSSAGVPALDDHHPLAGELGLRAHQVVGAAPLQGVMS